MSKKVSKTMIGAFVMGAVALLVAALLVFGSGKFFTKSYTYVMFFTGSVKGLSVGAPVMFKGVKIGSVKDINVVASPEDRKLLIPVYIELQPEKVKGALAFQRDPLAIRSAIDLGFRGQLQIQSFVTGQLMVALDFFPDKPAQYVGLIKEYPEIPTVPTPLEELTKTVEELPLKEIVNKLDLALDGIQKLVNAPETRQAIVEVNTTLKNAQQVLTHLDSKIGPLTERVDGTLKSAEGAFTQAQRTLALNEGVPADIAKNVNETLAAARETLNQANRNLVQIERITAPDSEMSLDVRDALQELRYTSRSVRILVDYLERHPDALLRGKASPKGGVR